jgi:hypothetical protein
VRLRAKYGIVLSKRAQMPAPKDVFDEIWGDYSQSIAHAQALARIIRLKSQSYLSTRFWRTGVQNGVSEP